MDIVRIKKTYLIIASILGLCVLLFISGLLLNLKQTSEPETEILPTPTAYPGTENIEQSDSYKQSIEQITAEQKETIQRSEKVGNLLPKLPYIGSYFAMRYDYATNEYIVVINDRFPTEGNAEFDAFLQNNGIENRTWIRRLVIR